MGNDKRKYIRVPVKVQVFLRDEDVSGVVYFYSRNLSTGGIFLETELYLDEGSIVDIEFTLPNYPKFIDIKAKIVWTVPDNWDPAIHPPGMGLEFIKLSEENKKIIENYIASKINRI